MNKYFLLMIMIFTNTLSFAGGRLSNLIMPVSYFIDHATQLETLANNLNKYKGASIVGISGMGKTQLARMYAYENRNNYDMIWFFDCNLNINSEALKLLRAINEKFKAGLPEDASSARKQIRDYLAHQERWLLVFDNLKINKNKKIQDFIDWEHNGQVIFCSQEKEGLNNILEITEFNRPDAVKLANDILENADPKSSEFLAESFKGYPILIVQGAQLLNQIKGLNKEEYQKKIHQSADKIKSNITLAIDELTPTAARLLSKIALINNQSFSKQLLSIITDNPATIAEDIFQLSKFMLVSNTNPNESNPIFEMHDVIQQKIMEINGSKSNKSFLDDIITRLVNSIPKSVTKGRICRNAKTVAENFEIISKNAEKYSVDLNKIMMINSHLATHYIHSFDYYNAEKKVDWFNQNAQKGKLDLQLMNNDERGACARYLGMIGIYYRNRYSDYSKAIKYSREAETAFNDVKGYETYKFNIDCQLAVANAASGNIQDAEQNVYKIEEMLNTNLVDEDDLGISHIVKARLLFVQGKYTESLEQVDRYINTSVRSGLSPNDLVFTNPYLLKAEMLNSLGKYQEAQVQEKQLYDIHKPVKKEDHEIFGRIFTQMARSALGLGDIDKASRYIHKAMKILLAAEHRNAKNPDHSENLDLAASYVVQGDILFAQNNFKEAIGSYRAAQKIYFYLYKNNIGNVAHVSYLYTQGAKASCKAKDLYHYKCFGKPQVKEFGREHKNTQAMLEYCEKYGMDLWEKEN